MKINRSRFFARRTIVLQNLAIVVAPFCLVSFIMSRLGFKASSLFLAIFLVAQPVLVVILTAYRLRMNHDGELLKKWYQKKERKISKMKLKIQSLKVGVINEYYSISNIVSEENEMCIFRILFQNEILDKAMPVIYLNDTKVPLRKISTFEVVCYAEKVINPDVEKLIFKSGESEYCVDNPYFMFDDIPKNEIIWQCEGHIHEKNIYINGKYFPYKNVQSLYLFSLHVDGKNLGEYSGKYVPKLNSIVIGIGSIKKSQCQHDNILIKPSFAIGKKIILPSPTVISVNNTPIKQISFF